MKSGSLLTFSWSGGGEAVLRAQADGRELARLEVESGVVAAARVELGDRVGRIEGRGVRPLRVCLEMPRGVPRLLFAGGLSGGLARTHVGYAYELWARLRRDRGPSAEWLNEQGGLAIAIQTGPDLGMVLRVAQGARTPSDAAGLALVWGFLHVWRIRRPWVTFTALGVGRAAIERVMDRMLRDLPFLPRR